MRRSRKPLSRVPGTGGSNPPLSAPLINRINNSLIHPKVFVNKIRIIFICLLFSLPLTQDLFSQSIKENWVLVTSEDANKIYLNVSDLSANNSDDIYVWVLEEFHNPLELEGVDDNIYQSKTYYLFNKSKKRYSILQVIYYDEDKNVLKTYSYEHKLDLPDFKYNAPILNGSTTEAIYNKCFQLTSPAHKN